MKRSLFIFITVVSLALSAQTVRPVKDDVGFCWNREGFSRLISYLDRQLRPPTAKTDPIIAGVSPHDDHLYAGAVYNRLFRDIHAREAVIFGVTHKTVRDKIGDPNGVLILDEFVLWPGLEKPVPVSPLRDHIRQHLDPAAFIVSNPAHELEHSIEALLPFLQYYNPEIRITPIMVTAMPFERMEDVAGKIAVVIEAYMTENRLTLGSDIVFLVSADGEHYGRDFNNTPYGEDTAAHDRAVTRDQNRVTTYLTGPLQPQKLRGLTGELWGKTYLDYRDSYWCGKYSIPFGLLTVQKIVAAVSGKELQGKLLAFADTYSDEVIPVRQIGCGLTAVFSLKHWVSFFSLAYRHDTGNRAD